MKLKRKLGSARATGLYRFCCLVTILVGMLLQQASAQEPVRLAVAANFKSTLEQIVQAWQQEKSNQNQAVISISSASTGTLFNQIKRGAPFDIFLSADERHPLLLEAHFPDNASEIYAIGRLVYWFPLQPAIFAKNAQIMTIDRLKTLITHKSNIKVAMANPLFAPYGKKAKSVMQKAALYPDVAERLILGNNVAQVFQFVFTGAASSGFVALSQVQQQKIDAEQWFELPLSEHDSLRQRMLLLRHSVAAKQVYQFLKSPKARHIIAQNGYALP